MQELKVDTNLIKRLKIITRKLVDSIFVGNYMSVFRGKGLEFDGYREYTTSDDVRLIDWKASARSSKLLVKEFVEERNLNIFFLVDVSSKMIFGSINKLKYEYVNDLVAALGYVGIACNDNIGLALFNDKIVGSLPPSSGLKQFQALLKLLSNLNLYGDGYNLSSALDFLMKYLTKRSLVIIISDFIELDQEWESHLRTISKKFDVIGIMVRDPRDRHLPDNVGEIIVGDSLSGKQLLIDPKEIKEQYESYVRQQEDYIKNVFIKNDIDFLALETDVDFIPELVRLFKIRERRWS